MLVDDASRAVLELAATQYGAFHRRQAAEQGFSNDRLRRGVGNGFLVAAVPNVFLLRSSPPSWRQGLMVASLSGGVASHRAAAALHGLDGFGEGVREVSVPREQEGRFPAMICHRWSRTDEQDLCEVQGIRTTSVARTLVQLGHVVQKDRVEQALDSALRDGLKTTTVEAVLRRLWRRGPTGAGVLREILESPRRLGTLPDSWFERTLASLLQDRGLPSPALQHPVATSTGTRRLDLAYPDALLGIEAHSRRFHFGQQQVDGDHIRDMELTALGWQLIYVTWAMTQQPDTLANQILQAYKTRNRQLRGG